MTQLICLKHMNNTDLRLSLDEGLSSLFSHVPADGLVRGQLVGRVRDLLLKFELQL